LFLFKIAPVSVMRLYGVTMNGNSVCSHVHGFSPYFYITAPNNFTNEHCEPFKTALNKSVLADLRSNREKIEEAVLEVIIVEKQSIMFYLGDNRTKFIRITMVLPRLIAAAKRLLEKENIYSQFDFQDSKAFETNIDIDIR